MVWAQQARRGRTVDRSCLQARPRPPLATVATPCLPQGPRPGPHPSRGGSLSGSPAQAGTPGRLRNQGRFVHCLLPGEALLRPSLVLKSLNAWPGRPRAGVELKAAVSAPLEMLSAPAKPSFRNWLAGGAQVRLWVQMLPPQLPGLHGASQAGTGEPQDACTWRHAPSTQRPAPSDTTCMHT